MNMNAFGFWRANEDISGDIPGVHVLRPVLWMCIIPTVHLRAYLCFYHCYKRLCDAHL